MLILGLIPTLLFLTVTSFLSSETYAEMSNTQTPKPCCMAGFGACPTPGKNGCQCCGFRVDATLKDYKNKKGSLQIEGLEVPIEFVVTKDSTDANLKDIGIGKSGKFILQLEAYEWTKDKKKKEGKRYECKGIDDGKLQDRTKEFVDGYKLTEAIYKVREVLTDITPQYPPERDDDKKKMKP
jgi:hypothetical protein